MDEIRLYPGAEEYYGREWEKSHFSERPLSCAVLPGAVVLPFRQMPDGGEGGGIVTSDGTYVSTSGVHNNFNVPYEFDAQKISKKNFRDEDVIYLGMFSGVWGHCLTDNIRRLWFFRTEEYRENYSGCRILYTHLAGFRFSDSFRKLLEILGVASDRLIPVEEITQFRNVILPDESFYTDDSAFRRYTREYAETIGIVKAHAQKLIADISEEFCEKYRRVYLSYLHFSKGKVYGEELLEEFFAQRGYTVVYPEQHSFEEQLQIFAVCQSLASSVGSCSHNCIFLQKDAELVLIPRSYYLTGYQVALNELSGVNVRLIDSSISNGVNANAPWGGPFCFTLSEELYSSFGEEKGSPDSAHARSVLKNYSMYIAQAEYLLQYVKQDTPEYYEQAVQNQLERLKKAAGISRFGMLWLQKYRLVYRIKNMLRKIKRLVLRH